MHLQCEAISRPAPKFSNFCVPILILPAEKYGTDGPCAELAISPNSRILLYFKIGYGDKIYNRVRTLMLQCCLCCTDFNIVRGKVCYGIFGELFDSHSRCKSRDREFHASSREKVG